MTDTIAANPNPMLTLLVSIISGGLAGGIVSAISNRIFHQSLVSVHHFDLQSALAVIPA
jgi:hypothetical protein